MKILIVDDEKLARMNILSQLEKGLIVIESGGYEDALRKLEQHSFDICYIDLHLDDSGELLGLKLIPEAVKRGFYTVVMSSVEDEAVIEKAYGLGCQDFYNKGNESKHIHETLNRFFLSRDTFLEERFFKDIIPTQNKRYKEELKKLLKVIPTDIPVCLLGESGTGKSHLARSIHDLSKRKGKFVELNCATLSGDTLKSELFGHVKGSFTGALSDKMGKLLEADGGTLFLDEIGSMSLEMQEGLLKAIEEKVFYPVGAHKIIRSDFRVICATLDDLELLIKSGKFRFDLFQRISGYTFTQPALRNRREDILPILKKKLSGSRKIIFKEEARKVLEEYNWPGNIRELLRFADMMTLSDSGVINAGEVNDFIRNSSFKNQSSLLTDSHIQLIRTLGMKEFLDLLSREIVSEFLKENENRARQTISQLKISSATFYRYISKEDTTFKTTRQLEVLHELQ